MNIAASITNVFFCCHSFSLQWYKEQRFCVDNFYHCNLQNKEQKKPTYFCIRSKAASFQEAICKARSAKARLNYNEINESTY